MGAYIHAQSMILKIIPLTPHLDGYRQGDSAEVVQGRQWFSGAKISWSNPELQWAQYKFPIWLQLLSGNLQCLGSLPSMYLPESTLLSFWDKDQESRQE